jgi:hypothetical protein
MPYYYSTGVEVRDTQDFPDQIVFIISTKDDIKHGTKFTVDNIEYTAHAVIMNQRKPRRLTVGVIKV